MSYQGRTIALYGDTGSGKTTQGGELAKYVYKTRGLRAVLVTSDMGGADSVGPLVRAGLLRVIALGPSDDPWIWIDDAVKGHYMNHEDGLIIFDSGTSMSEALLTATHKSEWQIGQQKTQKFTVSKGAGKDAKSLTVSINNEAHYGVVQGFLLDKIWESTWLKLQGIDVLWTFSVHRGEEQDRTPILGPKLAGKALTAAIPKWFNYTLRIASIPDQLPPRHVLYTTEHPELAGLGHSFGNARVPMGVDFPSVIEPASLQTFFEKIDAVQKEADEKLREELGL